MVVDTSVLVAMFAREADAAYYSGPLATTSSRLVSAATLVELTLVLVSRFGVDADAGIDRLVLESNLEVVPVTEHHARLARDGFVRYGKGRHPAGLNFGDCFSYALAKATGQPLLFKGNDFAQTDVLSAL